MALVSRPSLGFALQKSPGRPLGHLRGSGLSGGPDESPWPVTPSWQWWRGAAGACEVRHCSRVGARVGLLFPRSPPRGQCFGLPASRDARALVKSISSTTHRCTQASICLKTLTTKVGRKGARKTKSPPGPCIGGFTLLPVWKVRGALGIPGRSVSHVSCFLSPRIVLDLCFSAGRPPAPRSSLPNVRR